MCHAGKSRSDGIECRVAGGGRGPFADWKDRQYAVPDEFQHLAAECMNGTSDAVEPGVERSHHCLRSGRLGQFSKTAQVAKEQDCPDGLSYFTPRMASQHLCRPTTAQIGFEQCG